MDLSFRQNFLSVDKKIARCSFGEYYQIGDIVGHEGADGSAKILKFSIDKKSMEVKVDTDKGWCHLDFIFHVDLRKNNRR